MLVAEVGGGGGGGVFVRCRGPCSDEPRAVYLLALLPSLFLWPPSKLLLFHVFTTTQLFPTISVGQHQGYELGLYASRNFAAKCSSEVVVKRT